MRCACAQSRLCWGVPGSHDSAIAHLQNPIGYAPWVAVGQADAKTPQSRCGAEPHSSKLVVMELVDKEQNGREFLLKKISHLHEHEQRLTNSMNAISAPVLCHPCILISCSINAPHGHAWQGRKHLVNCVQITLFPRNQHRHAMDMVCTAIPECHVWKAPRSNSAASSVLLKVISAAVVSRYLRRCRFGKGPQPSFLGKGRFCTLFCDGVKYFA